MSRRTRNIPDRPIELAHSSPGEWRAAPGAPHELRQCLDLDRVALLNAAHSGDRRVQTEPPAKAVYDVAQNIVVLLDRVRVVGCHDAPGSQICQTDLGVRQA